MQTLAYYMQSAVLRLIARIRYELFNRRFRYTLHIGLVVSTLSLAVLASVIMAQRSPILGLAIVGVVAGGTALTLIYNYMEATLLLMFLSTTLLWVDVGKGLSPTLLLAIALAVVWLIRLILAERSFRSLRPMVVNRTVLIFIVAVVISYIWSTIYVSPAVRAYQNAKFFPRFATGIVIIVSPIVTLLFANYVRSIRVMQGMVWYYLGFGTVMLMGRFAGVEMPPFLDFTGQGSAWIAIFCTALLLFNNRLQRKYQLFLLALLGLDIYAFMFLGIGWLSGWVPMGLGICVVALTRTRWAFVGIVLVGITYVLVSGSSLSADLEQENAESGLTRIMAANLALDIANDHFLFGTGPTGYFFYLETTNIYMFLVSHNNYIDIYAQTGIVGLTAWLVMWLSIGWTLWRSLRIAPPEGVERALAAGFLACFVVSMFSMALGDWVTPFTYTQTIFGFAFTSQHWIWAGLGLSLYQHFKSKQQLAHES